ncbi:MAG: bifunctional pantoate--beta-alanine ligase/(d)CMP kinase [Cyanobacteriota bacterium]|nr:bifunctional pantoate--beta-alanine ligase/(d)CMP kinase [Cyanobacteriota bacterium]
MLLLKSIAELQAYRQQLNDTVGFVPTMGGLHAGHRSLIDRARRENSRAIVSIFVNPLQFGPSEDFAKYPRTFDRDRQLCEEAGVDAIFAPTADRMGTIDGTTLVVPPPEMTSVLCGRTRTGHFQGVATIVTKLLNLVRPDLAYFGRKDAQQLAIVRRFVADLNIPVEIVPCPIVREASGLAYSSRNQYLSPQAKADAAALYRSLQQAEAAFWQGDRHSQHLIDIVRTELKVVPQIELEYVELVHPETLTPLQTVEERGLLAIAARVGSTRLIDNVLLRQPIVAIDGPAGVGKSTVARQVAQHLGVVYLDTGAMYRAIAWQVLQLGLAVDDEAAIRGAIDRSDLRLEPDGGSCRVWIDDREITDEIRTPEVTAKVSAVSALGSVRRFLVRRQQEYGRTGGLVAEGRDIGTHVFPNADVKIFLTASVSERARRRHKELLDRGYSITLEELEKTIAERDRKDSTRAIAPLKKAEDAVEICTDELTVSEAIEGILEHCRG